MQHLRLGSRYPPPGDLHTKSHLWRLEGPAGPSCFRMMPLPPQSPCPVTLALVCKARNRWLGEARAIWPKCHGLLLHEAHGWSWTYGRATLACAWPFYNLACTSTRWPLSVMGTHVVWRTTTCPISSMWTEWKPWQPRLASHSSRDVTSVASSWVVVALVRATLPWTWAAKAWKTHEVASPWSCAGFGMSSLLYQRWPTGSSWPFWQMWAACQETFKHPTRNGLVVSRFWSMQQLVAGCSDAAFTGWSLRSGPLPLTWHPLPVGTGSHRRVASLR